KNIKRIVAEGGQGNDSITLNGILSPIEISGGPGNDIITLDDATTGKAIIRGDEGNDTITGGSGNDIIYGGLGVDTIYGGAGDDIIFGDSGSIGETFTEGLIKASDSKDIIYGGEGSDIIFGGGGSDELWGDNEDGSGDGSDVLIGDAGLIALFNGLGNWSIDWTKGFSGTMSSKKGSNDTIHGGSGNDYIFGCTGNDKLYGDGGDDIIFGEAGFDKIHGGAGNDIIFGDGWTTIGPAWSNPEIGLQITSGGEKDEIYGEGGDDLIYGGGGSDVIYGGSGNDRIYGGSGADTIYGDDGEDELFGQGESDTLYGGTDNDFLDGGAGIDFLYGGEGRDRLKGGLGSDFMDGEAGSDQYEINLRGGENDSLIRVFDSGTDPNDTDRLTVNGTVLDDKFLLRAMIEPLAFVALLNPEDHVERINYKGIERLVVNGLSGDDYFAVDDARAEATLNGGTGDDRFQIGQLYKSKRSGDQGHDAGIKEEDYFATIQTTRGWLSNGITLPMTIHGGTGNDDFVVFHNLAVLSLFGDEGDDKFLVKAFALAGSSDPVRGRTDITGGEGADNIRYAVNAPVNIDGGDGLDTVIVIGTEFADDFVITKGGVYGAGLNVNYVNIEVLQVDGAEGDDRFFVLSTNEKIVTEIFGGLGSDTFFVCGDTPPVISNDLLGHSGIITHSVESQDLFYDELPVSGISANVADNDEPFIVITPTDGSTIVSESGLTDSYTIVLTRQPTSDVYVKALAPSRTPEEEAEGSFYFRVSSTDPYAVNEPDGTAVTLRFTPDNWNIPQTVLISTPNNDSYNPKDPNSLQDYEDSAIEGVRFGVINHIVKSRATSYGGDGLSIVSGDGLTLRDNWPEFLGANENEPNVPTMFPIDGSLVGALIKIVSGPGMGQSRYIVSNTNYTLTIESPWDEGDLPTSESQYVIERYDNMALPRVLVRVEDNDAPGVRIISDGNPLVFEGGKSDTIDVVLNKQPSDVVTVYLTPFDPFGEPQIFLSYSVLTFTPSNWNIPKTVTISAINDEVQEGFQYGYISYRVESSDKDFIASESQTFEVSKDDPKKFVILKHRPVLEEPITVKVDGIIRSSSRYQIISSTVIFTDNGGLPEDVFGTIEVSYSYNVPGYDGLYMDRTTVLVCDNDAPGVLIQESGGSTDVIEGGTFSDEAPFSDTYTVVLTSQPSSNVIVNITPIGTKTSRGPIVPVSYPFAEQVEVSPYFLIFTPSNWNIPQTVKVKAVDDNWVDGSDTQVFAPRLHTLIDIQGPLLINGAGGIGSLAMLGEPLMLPGEKNIKHGIGNVISSTENTITVKTQDIINGVNDINSPEDLVKLINRTIEITEGPGSQQIQPFRLILDVEQQGENTILTVNESWGDVLPDSTSKFLITRESLNFFVDETKQVDFLFVYDTDSYANSTGVLTESNLEDFEMRINGLGMGPDTVIGGRPFPGGITYGNMEVLELNLGKGDNTFFVEKTHNRPDFQTWTMLNTGAGDDSVYVYLEEGTDGSFALDTQEGDDFVDARASSLPMYIFGGLGDDEIYGGVNENIIFGDRGRIDFLNAEGMIVTRLGFAPREMIGSVDSATGTTLADNEASFPIDNYGLSGLVVSIIQGTGAGQSRLILSNTETELTISEPWIVNPDHTSYYRISGRPEDQTDGVSWPTGRTIPIDDDLGGDDIIYGNLKNDLIYGGAGNDYIDGSFGTDEIYGGSGDDELSGGYGVGDKLYGEAGDDVIYGSDDGADIIYGVSGRDRIFGYGGNDFIDGGSDDDIIEGGPGDDFILGQAGSDLIVGGGDHDIIYGHNETGQGDDGAVDYLYGDFGTLNISSGAGNDRLYGGAGNDLIYGEYGDDYIDAGSGTSDLFYFGPDEGVNPSDYVIPTPTPNPELQTPINPRPMLTLPSGTDETGRWVEYARSATEGGLSNDGALSVEPDIVSYGGAQYVVWADNRNGNYEIYLARHTSTGWEEICGSAEQGGISQSPGSSRRPSMAITDDGKIIVSWTEIVGGSSDIRVSKYDPIEDRWVSIGDSLGDGGISKTGKADNSTVIIVGGSPVVFWLDSSNKPNQVYAKKFDGSSWVDFGSGSSSGGGITEATEDTFEYSVAVYGNKVALTWSQKVEKGIQIYLKIYDSGSWSELSGSASGGGVSRTSLDSRNPTVIYHNGELFVAWEQVTSTQKYERQIYVAKYRQFDGGWQEACAGSLSGGGISNTKDFATNPKFAEGGGKLYIFWANRLVDQGVFKQNAIYYKVWNGNDFIEELPGDATGLGVGKTESQTSDFSVTVDSSGHPFVVWNEKKTGLSEIYVRGNTFNISRIFEVDRTTDIQTLLDTHNLGPGDVILIKENNESSFVLSPDDSGLMIYGAPGARLTGDIYVEASNVLIQRLELNGSIEVRDSSGFVLRESTIYGDVSLNGGEDAYISHNKIYGRGVGIELLGESGITYKNE
ncbi:MAG: hypothetical protein QXS68_07275, partial [Candidatus Methanomethylicaceae archaeon]